jgi:hypothetical protein
LIERQTIDQLDCVEVRAVLFAGRVNRHNVCVMEPGSGFGLAVEALDRLRRQTQAAGEHLESDLAVERYLNGLIHDPHSTMADLPHDFEVTQAFAVFLLGAQP